MHQIRDRIFFLTGAYDRVYSVLMRAIEHIRKHIFQVSQTVFGGIAGTTQASVSRWETGELEPGLEDLARIRAEALSRDLPWDDRWFFEAPSEQGPAQ